MSVEHVTGQEYTFEVNFPEEGLNYRIDFQRETLRVNYLVVNCDRFPYKDLLSYRFWLGRHDIFIIFCQPSEGAKETVKFIIDGKAAFYEIPGELTVWLEDSGEVASLHTGDDPGELIITPKEAFILAANNTKHNQILAVSKKKILRKSGIPVPDQVLVEKEDDKLIISWPRRGHFFHKDMLPGLILILLGLAAWVLIVRYSSNAGDVIIFPIVLFVLGYLLLKKFFGYYKVVIEDEGLEVRSGFRGSKFVNAVNLSDVEKFEVHKDSTDRRNPYSSELCARKKSGEHETLLSTGSNEILAYLESELNLILHSSEHQPRQ